MIYRRPTIPDHCIPRGIRASYPPNKYNRCTFSGSRPVPALSPWGLAGQRRASGLASSSCPGTAVLSSWACWLVRSARQEICILVLTEPVLSRWQSSPHSTSLACLPVLPRCSGNGTNQARYSLTASHVFSPPCPVDGLTPVEDSPSQLYLWE